MANKTMMITGDNENIHPIEIVYINRGVVVTEDSAYNGKILNTADYSLRYVILRNVCFLSSSTAVIKFVTLRKTKVHTKRD